MQLTRRVIGGGVLAGGLYWLVRYLRPRHSTLVLNEKVVLITGASSGIGRSLAFAFARRAARVVLIATEEERLEAVRREIEPYTSSSLVIAADITQEADLHRIIETTLEAFGRIDVLVNSAEMIRGGRLPDQTPQQVEQLLRANLWSVIRLTQLVLPHMLAQNHGYILNVGSSLGRTAVPLMAPYVASKYGLSGFTDALRREMARTGVYLTLVQPGWTDAAKVPPENEDVLERYGYRIEDPDDVAERAVLGLVRGNHEVIVGGMMVKLGVLAERYVPAFVRLYWRVFMTPEWIATLSRIGRQDLSTAWAQRARHVAWRRC
jgi:short-subunit dehydrogenase